MKNPDMSISNLPGIFQFPNKLTKRGLDGAGRGGLLAHQLDKGIIPAAEVLIGPNGCHGENPGNEHPGPELFHGRGEKRNEDRRHLSGWLRFPARTHGGG